MNGGEMGGYGGVKEKKKSEDDEVQKRMVIGVNKVGPKSPSPLSFLSNHDTHTH